MEKTCWQICPDCLGRGKKSGKIRKKAKLQYQFELEQFQKSNNETICPIQPKAPLSLCKKCTGTGLIFSLNHPKPNHKNFPHIAIIGGGIGGVALAVACQHRGIPFSIYERDQGFESRSQGYGLTLQQASNAMAAFGILKLDKAVVSTRHVVHNTDGKIIGEWGMRKWLNSEIKNNPKRTNIHIARQSLRSALLRQLNEDNPVNWGFKLIAIEQKVGEKIDLSFETNGKIKKIKVDIAVGADGIRSTVRKLLIGENILPLHYLGCIVILGICSLKAMDKLETNLLDSETVFQSVNGKERIYIMPYDSDSVMWQLSFPMKEKDAKALSLKGEAALKQEASHRTKWHDPIPQIIKATQANQITGYPVYDRGLLTSNLLEEMGNVTLIGDAAHPMSPFKGQGANQALLDALSLARTIASGCFAFSSGKNSNLRKNVLSKFEAEMMKRSESKVLDSAKAAEFLHTDIALYEGNEPRGRCLKRKEF